MPSLRPRAMLIAGRSRGRPTRLLRTEEVTNSSSSLPTCLTRPLISVPAACGAVNDPLVTPLVGGGSPGARLYDSGLRNALNRRIGTVVVVPSGFCIWPLRNSGSIEAPSRHTVLANYD